MSANSVKEMLNYAIFVLSGSHTNIMCLALGSTKVLSRTGGDQLRGE